MANNVIVGVIVIVIDPRDLNVMRVEELLDDDHDARGVELLERIVAMLTTLIDP